MKPLAFVTTFRVRGYDMALCPNKELWVDIGILMVVTFMIVLGLKSVTGKSWIESFVFGFIGLEVILLTLDIVFGFKVFPLPVHLTLCA